MIFFDFLVGIDYIMTEIHRCVIINISEIIQLNACYM